MEFQQGNFETTDAISRQADEIRPPFVNESFYQQHDRRLYTKAQELYPQFAPLETSQENWYVINGAIIRYVNGKRDNKYNK